MEDWLPFGRESVEKYRSSKRSSVFSFDQLVCTAAAHPQSLSEAQRVLFELVLIRDNETYFRKSVEKQGIWKSIRFQHYSLDQTHNKECFACNFDCFLSAVVCPCNPSKLSCLAHSSIVRSKKKKKQDTKKFLIYLYFEISCVLVHLKRNISFIGKRLDGWIT